MYTVLITGCSSGIGRATARAFLEEEWEVYATSRDVEDVVDLDEAGCETVELDVTDGHRPRAVVDRIVGETGRLDCVVNNAGYAQFGPMEDVPIHDLHRQFDVNVYGPHRLARAALPHMRERGDGTIVNVSSVAGRLSYPGSGAYCASKHALEAASDALRTEVAEFGVDVVLVEPGPVETQFGERAREEIEEGIDRSEPYESLYGVIEDATLLGGDGPFAVPPGEVAETIVNAATCADPAARYPVGPVARLAIPTRHLPATWRDAAYRLLRRLVG